MKRKQTGKLHKWMMLACCLLISISLIGCGGNETEDKTADADAKAGTVQKETEEYLEMGQETEPDYSRYEVSAEEELSEQPEEADETSKSDDVQQESEENPGKTVEEGEASQPEEQPEEEQEPVEQTCTLVVECSKVFEHLDDLADGKEALLPPDGIIYSNASAAWEEGGTVFDILLREMQANKIHMEYSNTPAYDSAYIEGINNLYEFDCGELSGWRYSVNGEYQSYGCSQYEVQPGDVIEWHYSLDLGRDL